VTQRDFLLPDVGEGLIEADVVTWKVQVGDRVVLNQVLVDIESAKAIVELPSPYVGVVVALHAKEGDTVAVGSPLVTIEGEIEETPATSEKPQREAVLIGFGVAPEGDAPTTRTRRSTLAPSASRVDSPSTPTVSTGPASAVRAAPPVRQLAKQRGVDLATVTGTGPNGAITREDVERAVPNEATTAPKSPSVATRFVGRELASWDEGEREERIAIKGLLKVMADAMTESALSAPQAALWVRVDVSATVARLASLRANPAYADLRFSPLTLVAMAVVDAARHFPGINSFFDAAANEVVVKRFMNLGIAVNAQRGLLVPNVKNADQLDLLGMARALTDLSDRAREGKTTPEEMANGTFTITNIGPFGIDGAIPMLPLGTGAILCVGSVVKSPWVVDDQLVVRDVVEISMTFDHRHIDGALASSVLAHIAAYLREPPNN
jgi:pyruvate dehydrogenase E2 component (dihydrolipoamide acetyltransferase)